MQSICGRAEFEEARPATFARCAGTHVRTDRGRLMTYKHTYIHTYIHTYKQTKLPLSSLVRARCARPIIVVILTKTGAHKEKRKTEKINFNNGE